MRYPNLNDYNPDHFVPPRQYKPGLTPEPRIGVDGVVIIIIAVVTLLALFGVWYTGEL
jgi:hypothetical protein